MSEFSHVVPCTFCGGSGSVVVLAEPVTRKVEFDTYVARRMSELRGELPRVRLDTIVLEIDALGWRPAEFLEPKALRDMRRLNNLFVGTGARPLVTFGELLEHERPFRGFIGKRFRRAVENVKKRQTRRKSAGEEPEYF